MRKSSPRLQRLTKRAQFQAAASNGRRFRSSALSVQVLDRPPDDEVCGVRVGLTASRKAGNAVRRNRIRRRLRSAAREAFAESAQSLDVVAVARPETIAAPYDELVSALRHALTKARAQRKHHATSPGHGASPDPSGLPEPRETKRS